MTRKRIVLAALSALFLLTGCNRENPCKKYATKENFLDTSQGELYIRLSDSDCDSPRFDSEHRIRKTVESILFTPVVLTEDIVSLGRRPFIAEVYTHHTSVSLRLYPDLIHAAFYSERTGLHEPWEYSSFQTIGKEDGEKLLDIIHQAYQAGGKPA